MGYNERSEYIICFISRRDILSFVLSLYLPINIKNGIIITPFRGLYIHLYPKGYICA